eukprot:CAMPEP_0170558016 /NCGR_PEP_ID=MMETSP0211-20121228/32156_1 /TAXON_ID=311385 /ORGANISM="Pseudokeronopsis sp., Strain OXSARD2" /LENGTH=75 /DNA_ID=CAMNT_0010869565 /DNA_START=335 /DNA_END=562 /DNA_ORIENTATION=-
MAYSDIGLTNLEGITSLKDLAASLSRNELRKQVESIYDTEYDLLDEDQTFKIIEPKNGFDTTFEFLIEDLKKFKA